MRVVIQDYIVVNPYVIRVNLYTYNPDEQTTDQGIRDYEFAVGSSEFTTQEENGTVGIDLAKLQEILSQKIVESHNIANLVSALKNVETTEWDINVEKQPVSEDKDEKEGMTLAYGGETEANELTNT